MRRILLLFPLLLLPRGAAAAANEQLVVDVWCQLEPMHQESDAYPLNPDEARRRILEEARGILSAMLYGFQFVYTPADARRKTSEQFLLSPVAEIRWGDRRMRVAEAELREGRLCAKVLYDLQDFQSARRRAWQSNTIPTAAGSGACSLFTAPEPEGKRGSFDEALKDCLLYTSPSPRDS